MIYPSLLTAKLSVHYEAIAELRGMGCTWTEVKTQLINAGVPDLENKTGNQIGVAWGRTVVGVNTGRLVRGAYPLNLQNKTMPLGSKQKSEREQKTEDSATRATNRPLPVDPSKPRKMGSGSDEERFAKLRAMGIDTSSMEKE